MPVVTWWGHATTTVADSGTRILTDPLLTGRLGHLRRRRGPLPGDAATATADAVLISHLHADHLHLPSLAKLPAGTPVLLPRGALRSVPGLRRLRGLELQEVAAGEELGIGALRVRVVPARHDGRRWPVGMRRPGVPVQALGYVLDGAASTYFAGDTDLFAGMAEAVGRCDLALLPVGGWGPSLGPGHLNPERAAEAVRELAAGAAVPIHFGTMWPVGLDGVRPQLFRSPGREFVERVRGLLPGVDVRELRPGESAEFAAAGRAADGGSGSGEGTQ